MTGQTKNQNSQWWQEILESLPEVLGGVAAVVDASNGNTKPPTSTQNPSPTPQPNTFTSKKGFPWIWVVMGMIVLAAGAMIYIAKTKKG